MTAAAANWVWSNSRAKNGSLIVLLAIADEADKDGMTEMSVTDLARKARLSDRGVRGAVKDLERLGELSVTPRRGGISRYALRRTPADSAGPPRQILPDPPADSAGPAESAPRQNLPDPPEKPQVSDTPAESAGPEIPDALNGSVVSGRRSRSKRTSETPRPDVDRLCEHLASRIEANGSRRPDIGKRWKDAARLMIDNDGRSEDDIHKAIDWCQQHHFWHRQILSMEKLRQQYDRLRLDAKAEREQKTRPAQNGHQPTHEEFEALRQNWARPLDEQEAGIDPRGNGRPDRVHSRVLPAAENRQGHSGGLV